MTNTTSLTFFSTNDHHDSPLQGMNGSGVRRRRFLVCLLVVAAWQGLGGTRSTVFAQPEGNIKYAENAIDTRMRGSARVDPTTGALQIQIPLGNYPGRAGTALPITLSYSSKLWELEHLSTLGGPGAGGIIYPYDSVYLGKYSQTSAAGWTSSLDWFRWPSGEPPVQTYDDAGRPAENRGLWRMARMFVRLPDSSKHELRRDDERHSVNGYNGSGVYYSVDGSRLRYETATGTLYLPDGSRFVGGQYVDRHGNTLTYDSSTGTWTDTLGRTTPLPLPISTGVNIAVHERQYTLPGVGGANRTYTFRWRKLKDSSTGASVLTDGSQSLRSIGDRGTGATVPSLFSSPDGYSGGDDVHRLMAGAVFNPTVLHQIELPDGSAYTFTYNVYGEIDHVVYPTGGSERFGHGVAPAISSEFSTQDSFSQFYSQANRGVVSRRVSVTGADSPNDPVWQYEQISRGTVNIERGTVETQPDGTRIERWVHRGSADVGSAYGMEDPRAGMIYEEAVYAPNNGPMLRRSLSEWVTDGTVVSHATRQWYKTRNPRVTKSVSVVLDTGGDALAKTTVYGYDTTYQFTTGVNRTSVTEYDYFTVPQNTAQTYGIGSFPVPAQPLRVTETAYLDGNTSYRDRNLLGLPTSVTVKKGADIVAQTTTSYDEPGYQLGNTYGAVVGWADPGTTARGNATTQRAWVNTTNTWLETHATYDQVGNVVSSQDARTNVTQFSYTDSFTSAGHCTLPDGSTCSTYAFPTQTTSAVPDPTSQYGSDTPLVTSTVYDYRTGLVTSTTDANGKVTSFQYIDWLGRPTRVDRPDGGWTIYGYGRSTSAGVASDYVRTLTALDGSRSIESYQFFDGLGRPNRTLLNDGGTPTFITSDTQYDTMGRAWRVSNPYRTSGSGDGINPPGRWTTTAYDALGRVKTVTTPDGAAVKTDYDGARVLVTDQADKQRISRADALGRLREVWEIWSSNPPPPGTEAVTFPSRPGVPAVAAGYKTAYDYDALGNLRQVTQGGQSRFFAYDSLSRLTRAKNPEQAVNPALNTAPDPVSGNTGWSMAYFYDENGNLAAKIDPRGVTASYTYDALNRMRSVGYSDGVTPSAFTVYDKMWNGRGRFAWNFTYLTATSANTHVVVDAYDEMGRATIRRQHFWVGGNWGPAYPVSRTYDKLGNVTSQTYPSGHTVSYKYDAAGRPGDSGGAAAFSGNLGDGVTRSYASQIAYDEAGRMHRERLGTKMPLYHKLRYTVRGQLWDVRLSTVNDADNWNRGMVVNHYSTAAWTQGWGASGADNNGNVLRSHHYVPADDQISSHQVYYQDYEYDSLNRLKRVTETSTPTWAQQYVQAYDYDRYGNRTINAAATYGAGIPEPGFELNPQTNPEVAEPSNRLYAPGDAGRAPSQKLMRYDAAGNLVHDGHTGGGARTYDANNRMTAAWGYSGLTGGSFQNTYAYDADGLRVRRTADTGEVWHIYGFGGELLAEYQAGAATNLATKEYGYRGGELLVTAASGDDGRMLRFLHKLYNALGRGPNATEQQQGMAALTAAAAQGRPQLLQASRDLAAALFNSGEYAGRGRTDAQFVTDLYWTYPQRQPDAGGYGAWLNAVALYGRAATRDGFAYSPEFDALTGRVYGVSTGEDERTELFIHKLYASLARDASGAELSARVTRIDDAAVQGRTQTVEEARAIGRELFQSQEYANRGRSDRDFVRDLYVAFLDREPDAGGWDAWTNAVGPNGRPAVLNWLSSSAEFDHRASTLYREVNWLVSDHLGTPRMVADRSGKLAGVKRHDYLPFGEEIGAGTGGRTTQQGYSVPDGVRQHFSSKERDTETGLDYFGARYYSSTMGRFTTPDEFTGGPEELYEFDGKIGHNPTFYAELAEPQSLNKYHYCLNNPLRYVDLDGHQTTVADRLRQAAEVAADLTVGVARGAAASISFGIARGSSPEASDSLTSRLGQAIGTGVIGGVGGGLISGGVGMTVGSGGTALLTGVPEVAVVTGAVLTVGAAKNGIALVTTPMQMSNNSSEGSSGDDKKSGGEPKPKKDESVEGARVQRENIEQAQKVHRSAGRPDRIRSIEKSKQNEKRALKKVKSLKDVEDN